MKKEKYNLYRNIIESALAEGSIVESDLEDVETLFKAIEIGFMEPDLRMVIDHRSSVLEQVESFADAGNYEYSLLFYATFFEHCINAIIIRITQRKKLSHNAQKQLKRTATIHAKFTWVIELLELPKFNEKHLKIILDYPDASASFSSL